MKGVIYSGTGDSGALEGYPSKGRREGDLAKSILELLDNS